MNWLIVLVGAGVVVLEGWSFWSSLQTRHELASGKATRDTLIDFTGEFDPIALDRLIGAPDDQGRYDSSGWRDLPRSPMVVAFDQPVLSVLLVVVALAGMVLNASAAGPLLVFTAAAWSAIGFVFVFFAANRYAIDAVHPIDELILCDLETDGEDLPRLWGPPLSTVPHAALADAEIRTYRPSVWFEIEVALWKGKVHEVTVWSASPAPGPDLTSMMRRYGDGKRWRALDFGYQYLREDDARMLRCSRVPAITVTTRAYRTRAGVNRALPSQPVPADRAR